MRKRPQDHPATAFPQRYIYLDRQGVHTNKKLNVYILFVVIVSYRVITKFVLFLNRIVVTNLKKTNVFMYRNYISAGLCFLFF